MNTIERRMNNYGERNNARGKELEPVKQFLKDRGYKMTVIKKYVYAEKEKC